MTTSFVVKGLASSRPAEAHSMFQPAEEKRPQREGPLVIPLVAASPGDDGASAAEKAAAAKLAEATQPLLAAGQLPGLSEIADEGEKFRRDLSMRAADVEASSDTYAKVPIGEFGAAVLRGMGWKGPTKEDEARFAAPPEPRHYRLGLGAQPKPKELFDRKGRLRADESAAKKRKWLGASREEAACARKTQRLAVGDVATCRGRRCRVLELSETGAAFEFETTGERGVAGLGDLVRVSAQSLLTEPFVDPPKSRKKNQQRNDSRNRDERKLRQGWLCAGIRVRVARPEDPHYRQKAVVLDVLRHGSGLRALLHLDSGAFVHDPGMKEKHLETALPKEGGRIKVVAGPRRGRTGHLVRRDKADQSVLARLDDDLDLLSLPMDDVAELCGGAD